MEQAQHASPPSLASLYIALAQAQAEFLPIEKNREGQDGNRKFKYADLDELIKKTRPALAKHKLCVIQLPNSKPDGSYDLRTVLAHESGCTVECTIDLPKVFDGIKKFGGAITFLRRYAYQAVLCISADDDLDDGGAQDDPARHEPANDNVPRNDPPAEDRTSPGMYPDADFQRNLPTYRKAVESGAQTPEDIIAMVSSRRTLTEEQKTEIMGLAKKRQRQE